MSFSSELETTVKDLLIHPQSLKSLSLFAFSGVLHKALQVARCYTQSESCDKVRQLLALNYGAAQDTIILSTFLSDEVISCCATNYTLTGTDLSYFCSSKLGSITKIDLLNCTAVTEQAFRQVTQHHLLEFSVCVQGSIDAQIQHECLDYLGESPAAETLISLTIRFEPPPHGNLSFHSDFKWLINLKKLVRLDMCGVYLAARENAIASALDQLPNLSFINISKTVLRFFPIVSDKLTVLIANNSFIFSSLPTCANILKHDSLVSIDISRNCNVSHTFEYDTTFLIERLAVKPNLRYLDVSGLVVSADAMDFFDHPHPRMQFLGLLKTRAASRKDINSEMVSGDVTLDQLLVSLRVYAERDGMIEHVAIRLFEIVELGHVPSLHNELVQAIMNVIESVDPKKSYLLSCLSGSLWYLCSQDHNENLSNYSVKRVFSVLIRALEKDLETPILSEVVFKNYLITFCHFDFPEVMFFAYSRMVKMLVGCMYRLRDVHVKKIIISLMNAVVWQVTVDQKLLMKKYGGIKAALEFIADEISSDTCDDGLEMAWTFLWNATDESPGNSSRLVEEEGVSLFINCYKSYHDNADFSNVLRNMLGTLGNVAEVPSLRPHLLDTELIQQLRSVLLTVSIMEVQYNVCGIIMNLAFVDERTWVEKGCCCQDTLLSLTEKCIDTWDLAEKRIIEYRSLRSLITITANPDERVAHWGVWALTNLCQVYPHKYLVMFRREGGIEAADTLLEKAKTVKVKELAITLLAISKTSDEDSVPTTAAAL